MCGVGFAERKTAAHDLDAHEVAKRRGSLHFEQGSADETEVGEFFDSAQIFRNFHDNAAGADGKLVEGNQLFLSRSLRIELGERLVQIGAAPRNPRGRLSLRKAGRCAT